MPLTRQIVAMQVVLKVVKGPHEGRSFAFDGHDNFIVGRARCAHFRLPKEDPFFSRVHFMVEVNPPSCRLVDMGSTNGTRLNDEPVDTADLKDGDLIEAGNTVLMVSFCGQPDANEISDTLPQQAAKPTSPPQLAMPSTAAWEINDRPTEKAPANETLPCIPGYEVLRALGKGGMGVVYLCRRSTDSSTVAVKIIRPAALASELQVQHFLREASILKKLRHPHIVAFHEMGQAGDILYFAMEYVEGTDAARLVKNTGPLAIGEAVRIACQALEAIHYANVQGFVHRDIKPANLLLSGTRGNCVCKLADFGLARVYNASPLSGLTMMGNVGGTIPYMPPEQITDYRHVDMAADQYAMAATLYILLTGSYVFDFDADRPLAQQLSKILLDPPVPIRQRRDDVPEELARAIHRALEKEPAKRFPDAKAFRDAMLPFG